MGEHEIARHRARAATTWSLILLSSLAIAGCEPGRKAAPADLPLVTPAGLERVAALPAPYASADAELGRRTFALCAGCHGMRDGEPQDKGPVLKGVFGRPAAARADYAYSEALRESGFVWDARRLEQWIFNPHETLPGTTMAFIGIRNDAKRRGVIAYLAAEAGP